MLWLHHLRAFPAVVGASALVISTAVAAYCAYQTDWQLVSECVNKTRAEFKSLTNVW